MFGPAVQAAGGVQLPEEVVNDIFDRADKDRDGVIAGEEIRHVSGRCIYLLCRVVLCAVWSRNRERMCFVASYDHRHVLPQFHPGLYSFSLL